VTVTHFCSHCNANQPTFEYLVGKQRKMRCRVCGYPVEEKITDKAPHQEADSSTRPKILCIDDDQLLLSLVRDLLRDNDFEPLTATDGVSGIEIARREEPALILLDVMLPGTDGFQICRQMRADPALKDTPIIIVTAMVDPKLSAKGFQAGATLATNKPYEPAKLINTIKTALALKAKSPPS
jgi:putative two-component system response regulator